MILNIGETTQLPDGRVLKFVGVDITALDNPCYGCALENEHCSDLDPYTGPCGSGRPDGEFGIFQEVKLRNDG